MFGYDARKGSMVFSSLGKWAYNLCGFNQYGLHSDDCLYENEDVKEAIRRLPRNLYDERHLRIMRALHLSMIYDVYIAQRTMESYLKEVVKEREEREEWINNH